MVQHITDQCVSQDCGHVLGDATSSGISKYLGANWLCNTIRLSCDEFQHFVQSG